MKPAMAPTFLSRLAHLLKKEKTAPVASQLTIAPGTGALLKGRYQIEAEIGRGGMGIVYRGRDLPMDRDVAIKIVNVEHANALTRQRFAHEAEISVRLQHPHVVAVYETGIIDTGTEDPVPFIVMEWVQAQSLDALPRLTFNKILEIGIQICDVLEYIHRQGFVYRDLKPGNILLETRGFHYFVKLTDFGLARPLGMPYLENESSLAGTPFYLAPELIAGQLPDVASDLYALGVTLYEWITGRPPFFDIDEKNILLEHREGAVRPPGQSRSDVPPALESIVLRLLAKNPKDRFASAQDVRDALEQIRAVRASRSESGNLPQLSRELPGHDDELAQIKKMLEASRVVTLVDGAAAEALALVVGSQLAHEFQDGIWWVNLEPIDDPAQVLETVASLLGICRELDRPLTASLIEHLHEKNLLLLLNRCEHVTGACAQLVETTLDTCPDVRILVISQQPLNLAAEKCYPLSL